MLADKKVVDFIAELASDSPAPGGGSVAALSGSLGAGLLSMVCNLTIGKKGYEDVQEEMEATLVKSDLLHKKLTNLIDEDANAFNAVIAAFRMPKESEEEKEKRTAAIQTAYKIAADIPFTIATTCLEVLELGQGLVAKANTNAISDVGVAALTSHAGVEGALMNVTINLPSIKDPSYVQEKEQQIDKMLSDSKKLRDEIYQKVINMLKN